MCVFQWQNRWQLLNLQICQITFGSSISFSIWQADEAFEEGVLLAGAHLVRWRSSLTTRPSRKKEVFVFTMSYPSVLQCHKTEPTIQTKKKVIGFQDLTYLFIFLIKHTAQHIRVISMILQRLFHFHIYVKFFHFSST